MMQRGARSPIAACFRWDTMNRQNSLFSFPGPSALIFQPGTGQGDRPSLGTAAAAPPSPFQMNQANGPIMPGHPPMHRGRCGSFPAFLLERCGSARSARPLIFSNSRGKWNPDGMRRVFAACPIPIQHTVFMFIFNVFQIQPTRSAIWWKN
jgi:hypothetical protein